MKFAVPIFSDGFDGDTGFSVSSVLFRLEKKSKIFNFRCFSVSRAFLFSLEKKSKISNSDFMFTKT